MKRIAALMMVKDEIDVIEANIHYLSNQYLDKIYVYDNGSTDGTREKLSYLSVIYNELVIKDDPIVGYYQSEKMNKWSNELFQKDIDVIIPIDADEIWYSKNPEYTLGEAIRRSDADIFVARAEDYVPTIFDDFTEKVFYKRIRHKKVHSDSFSSVAFNYSPEFYLEMGNHNVLNHPGERAYDVIGIKHYQYRSFSQFCKKVRNGKTAYDATNLPDYMGSHWRRLGAMSAEELKTYWNQYCSLETIET
jgi:hypothetical protein